MRPYLEQSDERLLADCDIHIYKASGPGGQHRNKVSSAIRLKHRPTKISAVANDSRSQHSNRQLAMKRLRMNLCCKLRHENLLAPEEPKNIPKIVAQYIFVPKKMNRNSSANSRMDVGRKDANYWLVGAYLLDWLEQFEGQLGEIASILGISTGNLVTILKKDRHLLAAAQGIRQRHNKKPIR